ncbi:unnamed protein product [Ixodes pacificus]
MFLSPYFAVYLKCQNSLRRTCRHFIKKKKKLKSWGFFARHRKLVWDIKVGTYSELFVLQPPNKTRFEVTTTSLKIIAVRYPKLYLKSQETVFLPLKALKQFATEQNDIARASRHRFKNLANRILES